MGLIIYTLCWFVFASLHSLLARQSIQERLETFLGNYYRLTYNVVAAVKISVVLYVGSKLLSNSRFALFENDIAASAAMGVYILGFIVLALALSMYDIGRFSGITQVFTRERVSASINEPLQRRFLNKWVRHPLYTGAFLVLWGGAVSSFDLWTALLGTLYLLIGTSFEERKLNDIYGEEYRVYQQEVPRYFPSLSFNKH